MAGYKLRTDLSAKTAYNIARKVARDLDFSLTKQGDNAFSVEKGNFPLSIFLGAFVAYCHFQVDIEEYDDSTDIIIERNSPWWTGWIGVKRVQARAKELADCIADAIEDEGGKILKAREF